MTVSVIMLTYKHENFIRDAIEGVLMQETDFEFELIIVNDCSPDKTGEIIEKCIFDYQGKNKIRYYFQEKNIGLIQNFSFAYNKCRGKYIAICEGDDYWTDRNKLQKQIDFLEAFSDLSSCFHKTKILKNNEELIYYRDYLKERYKVEDTIDNIALCHTSSFVFRHQTLSIPLSVLEIISWDMTFFTFIATKGDIGYLPYEMSVYRKHDENFSSLDSQTGKTGLEKQIARLEYIDSFLNYKYSEKIEKVKEYYKKELFYYTFLGRLKSAVKLRTRIMTLFDYIYR